MGLFAEKCAGQYPFSREQQDEFAITSLRRAQAAIEQGSLRAEISPVTVNTRKGAQTIALDESPGKANFDNIPRLKPAFKPDGSVTAANASSISDGAAALVLMRASDAEAAGKPVQAIIRGYSSYAGEPCWFTTAPVFAIQRLLQQLGWTTDDVDLWEINEAFAVVTLAAMQELELDHAKVNVHGGACALGHPIGASGARIIVTLLSALQQKGLKRGIASLCIGGGEAMAIALEVSDEIAGEKLAC
jgi:acetyl-CoA C-acetyltransferase